MADDKAFLGFADVAMGKFLKDHFAPVLDNPQDDVHWVPQEQVYGRRKQDVSVDDYTTPFIIFYRPNMHTLAKEKGRSRLLMGNGFPFCIPGEPDPFMAKVVPQDVSWIITYYTNDRDERDYYGTLWNQLMFNHPLIDVEFPISDSEIESVETTAKFAEPDDMSDADGWLSTGDDFRVEGEGMATVYTFNFQSDDSDPSVPPPQIKQVLIELFAQYEDDKKLVQEVYESIDNLQEDTLDGTS